MFALLGEVKFILTRRPWNTLESRNLYGELRRLFILNSRVDLPALEHFTALIVAVYYSTHCSSALRPPTGRSVACNTAVMLTDDIATFGVGQTTLLIFILSLHVFFSLVYVAPFLAIAQFKGLRKFYNNCHNNVARDHIAAFRTVD